MPYTGTYVQEYRSHRNVVFACHSHAVCCPNSRRTLLVGTIPTRFKQIMSQVCQEHQAERKSERRCQILCISRVPVDPQFAIHRLMKCLTGRSSRCLRQALPQLTPTLPTLWTTSSFVSTSGDASLSVRHQAVS